MGCAAAGQYRAPKSPDHLDEYFWFCRDHVREYNLKWNFFQGTTDDEFQKFLDKDRVWERETKPFSRIGDGNAWARLGVNDPMALLGEKATQNPGRPNSAATRKLPPTERKARTGELTPPGRSFLASAKAASSTGPWRWRSSAARSPRRF